MLNIYQESSGLIWQRAYKRLVDEIRGKEKCVVLLSGGSVVALYPSFADYIRYQKPALSWGQVDERFQPLYPGDINKVAIEKTGLTEISMRAKVPYFLISQEGTLERAALDYNTNMSELFEQSYKVAILGIGEDGHTAGLLPGYGKDWDKDRYVVGYELGKVERVEKVEGVERRRWFWKRISLTPKALRMLDYALVVVVGEKKREALQRLVGVGQESVGIGQSRTESVGIGQSQLQSVGIGQSRTESVGIGRSQREGLYSEKLDECPALILQEIKKVDVFTDINV